jgi:transcriptional regulator with XRE-family HTH domain
MTEQAEAPEVKEGSDEEAVLADVGERVKLARQGALLTQAMLGDSLGMTGTAVSYWESGKRDMGIAVLLRIAEACRVPASSLLPAEHQDHAAESAGEGRFATIAFMGHNEYTGYVTEIVKNGQPAYHVDLPEKLWGGNPLNYVEYAATAWFSDRPVTEAYVRRQWESAVRAAAERARQEAEWRRAQEQRALTTGEFRASEGIGDDDDDEGYLDDDD